MSKKTRMTRISMDLDDLLGAMAQRMSAQSGRKITKTEVSALLAAQTRQPTIIQKRGKKFLIGGSWVSL